MIYTVIRPLVVVRSHGDLVYRTAGQEVDGVSEEDAARLVGRGMIVAARESVDPPEPDPFVVPDPAAAVIEPSGPAGKPKRTAPLSAWQEYAKTAGLSEEDIDGATKAELIAALS